jgi:hypothetical protein
VEVDSTYYALPSEQTAELWAERTPPAFTFNIKAFSLFTQHPTHLAALPTDLRPELDHLGKDTLYLRDVPPAVTEQVWERFLAALAPLREAGKLGAILLQFPPWFAISRARKDYLVACAQRAAPDRVCIEFRNHTWMTEANRAEPSASCPPTSCPMCAWTCRKAIPALSRGCWPPPPRWPWSASTATRPAETATISTNGSATAIALRNSPAGHPRSAISQATPRPPTCCLELLP